MTKVSVELNFFCMHYDEAKKFAELASRSKQRAPETCRCKAQKK